MLLAIWVFACDQSTTETNSPVERPKVVLSDSSTIAHPVGYQFPEGETFKVLSWNVEHFVDDFDNPYINNRREDNPPTNMLERRARLAEVLKLADADIIVFQEFESSTYAKGISF